MVDGSPSSGPRGLRAPRGIPTKNKSEINSRKQPTTKLAELHVRGQLIKIS